MLFPRKLAFMLCAVSAMFFGAGNIAQATPATGLVQATVVTTAAPLTAVPSIEKAYYHHRYYRHHGYGWRHHGYGWHHGYGHWRHPYWRHHRRYY